MDAIFASQTLDRKGRHLKTQKRIPNHVNGHRSFDLRLTNGAVQGGGGGGGGAASVLFTPAWTDPYSILYSNVGDLGYHVQPTPPPQPLLPLPPLSLSKSYNSNLKALSYPPSNNSKGSRKPYWSSSSSSSTMTSLVPSPLTPQKSSPKSKPHLKKDQKNSLKPAATQRPDPAELSRNGFKGNLNSGKQQVAGSEVEFSGPSIYILAPPPSSLPFPSFALRPKLGCNAEAAASGICTNDGLRRIQRIP